MSQRGDHTQLSGPIYILLANQFWAFCLVANSGGSFMSGIRASLSTAAMMPIIFLWC